jgi:hypothetical protein
VLGSMLVVTYWLLLVGLLLTLELLKYLLMLGSSLDKELRYICNYVLAYIPVRCGCVQLIIVYPGMHMCDMHLPWYAHACYK